MTVWTALVALIASGTALWVAYFVYPVQKNLDRDLDAKNVLNEAYVELLSTVDRAVSAGLLDNELDGYDLIFGIKEAANRILLLDPHPPIEALSNIVDGVTDVYEQEQGAQRVFDERELGLTAVANSAKDILNHQRRILHGNQADVDFVVLYSNKEMTLRLPGQ